jgi:hypothetical protein
LFKMMDKDTPFQRTPFEKDEFEILSGRKILV